MPPFQYPEIHPSPYAGSIADILLRKGDIAAHAAEQIGAAQAGAAAASGQAWGGVIAGAGQAIGAGIQRANDPRIQTEALNLEEQRKAIAEHDTFKAILKSTPPIDENGMKLYDLPTLAKKSTDAGLDPSAYLEHYGNVNAGFRNEYQARLATVQAGARGLMLAPDPVLAKDFLDRLEQNHTISPEVHAHYNDLLAADSSPQNVLKLIAPFSGQTTVMGKEGETPVSSITGQPVGPTLPKTIILPRGGASVVQTGAAGQPPTTIATSPAPPTTASIAMDAATAGTPNETPTAKQSATAMNELKPPRPEPPPRSMDEQLLEAITKGDTASANRITATLQAAARAKQDPAAAALAMQLRNLSVKEAQAKLDALQAKNGPLDISGNINTTMGGRKYINLSEFQTPEDRKKAQEAATAQGIMPVDKDTGAMLSDLDTARQNQQTMMSLIESKLPKDAAGRLLKGPSNKLEALMQSDPDLASMGTFRNAAIQSMRAVAGSKGLRINQMEVQLAIDNDIPKMTDTLDTARQKLANLSAFMDNIEKAHLVRNREATKGTEAPTSSTITVVRDANGKLVVKP